MSSKNSTKSLPLVTENGSDQRKCWLILDFHNKLQLFWCIIKIRNLKSSNNISSQNMTNHMFISSDYLKMKNIDSISLVYNSHLNVSVQIKRCQKRKI